MNTKEGKRNEKNFIVMILILIALIIIIFLLVRNLGFIDHKPRIPTGNVDVFDIIFQQNCNNDCCKNNVNCENCDICNKNNMNCTNFANTTKNNSSNATNNGTSNNVSSTKPTDEKVRVEIFDKDTKFSYNTPLNIFTNTTYYVVDNKIAPLSENSYQFVIKNNNSSNIKYNLEFNENNTYRINMKYRLKVNGAYVAGNDDNWLTYRELKQNSIGLSANNYDAYTIDWKWEESENDTEVGTNINSNYKLELKITASEY